VLPRTSSDLDTALVQQFEELAAELPGARRVPTLDSSGAITERVWVPLGPGLEIPPLFQYEGGAEFTWKIIVAVIEGRPQCVALQCYGQPITPAALHKFPLGRMVEEAALMSSRPIDEIPHRHLTWPTIKDARRAQAEAVRAVRAKRASKRRTATDELLAKVAEVYRQNIATNKPSKEVAEHFNYSQTSARRLVRLARERGFLGPAIPGVGGETRKENNDV
jgi:hypothetical protein